jgi:SAM-dependent methyltransferase
MNTKWSDDLCEYYKVDEETALELGTRSSGRKPNLPGSATCEPVSEMTYEDIWAIRERNDTESVFQFYRDQGAWATFRQCVRHKDMVHYHMNVLSSLFGICKMREAFHICEYGCGVAPFMNTLLNFLKPESSKLRISISDVKDCEHFKFAEWRLDRKIKDKNLDVDLNPKPITHNSLPKYDDKLDLVLVFEVLEHVPSPISIIKNIHDQLNDGGIVVENFIKHDDDDHHADDSDLDSAAEEREGFYKFLNDNFHRVMGNSPEESPNETRAWRKK